MSGPLLPSGKQRFKPHALSQSVKAPAVVKVNPEVPNAKRKTKQLWIPRAEFFAKLESDRDSARNPILFVRRNAAVPIRSVLGVPLIVAESDAASAVLNERLPPRRNR